MWGLVVIQVGHDWGFFTILTDLPKYIQSVLRFDIAKVSDPAGRTQTACCGGSKGFAAGFVGFVFLCVLWQAGIRDGRCGVLRSLALASLVW